MVPLPRRRRRRRRRRRPRRARRLRRPRRLRPPGADLAPDQTLRIYCRRDRSPVPQPAGRVGLGRDLGQRRDQSRAPVLDKDLKVVPELAEAMPDDHGRWQGLHLQAEGRQVQQRRPDRRRPTSSAASASSPTRATHTTTAYEMCLVAGADAVMGADFGCAGDTPYKDPTACAAAAPADVAKACVFDDATIDDLLRRSASTAPDDKTVVVTPGDTGELLHQHHGDVARPPRPTRSVIKYAEAADLDLVRSVHDGELDPQQRDSSSSRTRTGPASSRP